MLKFERNVMPVLAVVALLIVGAPAALWAAPVPEIDPSSGMSALALVAGAVVLIRGMRRK
jgi:hypothetical protein